MIIEVLDRGYDLHSSAAFNRCTYYAKQTNIVFAFLLFRSHVFGDTDINIHIILKHKINEQLYLILKRLNVAVLFGKPFENVELRYSISIYDR